MRSHIARNTNIMGPWLFLFLNIPKLFALTYYGFKRMNEEQGLLMQ